MFVSVSTYICFFYIDYINIYYRLNSKFIRMLVALLDNNLFIWEMMGVRSESLQGNIVKVGFLFFSTNTTFFEYELI